MRRSTARLSKLCGLLLPAVQRNVRTRPAKRDARLEATAAAEDATRADELDGYSQAGRPSPSGGENR